MDGLSSHESAFFSFVRDQREIYIHSGGYRQKQRLTTTSFEISGDNREYGRTHSCGCLQVTSAFMASSNSTILSRNNGASND